MGRMLEGKNTTFRVFLCQFVEHKKLLVWKMFHSNLIRLVSFEEVFATLGIEFKMCKHENDNVKFEINVQFSILNDFYTNYALKKGFLFILLVSQFSSSCLLSIIY